MFNNITCRFILLSIWRRTSPASEVDWSVSMMWNLAVMIASRSSLRPDIISLPICSVFLTVSIDCSRSVSDVASTILFFLSFNHLDCFFKSSRLADSAQAFSLFTNFTAKSNFSLQSTKFLERFWWKLKHSNSIAFKKPSASNSSTSASIDSRIISWTYGVRVIIRIRLIQQFD